MRILIFNGPPSSGKDAAARMAELIGAKHLKMASPMKEAIHAFFPLPRTADPESIKEEPVLFAGGKTLRQCYISLSEDWAKVQFGDRIFGKLLAHKIVEDKLEKIVLSDGGFYSELVGLAEGLGDFAARAKVLIIRIHRDGKDYKNDSRGYITDKMVRQLRRETEVDWEIFDVYNNGSLEDYQNGVFKIGKGFYFPNIPS